MSGSRDENPKEQSPAAALLSELSSYEPADEIDRKSRALYFATALGVRSVRIVREWMDYCLSPGSYGNEPDYDRSLLKEELHHESVKELLGLSIWLTMVDQLESEVPQWLRDFFIDCWWAADELYPQPSSREIMRQYYGHLSVKEVCSAVSASLCERLGLGGTKGDAFMVLGEMLWEAGPARADLLRFALRKTLEELDADIHSMRATRTG